MFPPIRVIIADTAATDEDKPVTFTVLGNDTDPDGDTLTVTAPDAKGLTFSA